MFKLQHRKLESRHTEYDKIIENLEKEKLLYKCYIKSIEFKEFSSIQLILSLLFTKYEDKEFKLYKKVFTPKANLITGFIDINYNKTLREIYYGISDSFLYKLNFFNNIKLKKLILVSFSSYEIEIYYKEEIKNYIKSIDLYLYTENKKEYGI